MWIVPCISIAMQMNQQFLFSVLIHFSSGLLFNAQFVWFQFMENHKDESSFNAMKWSYSLFDFLVNTGCNSLYLGSCYWSSVDLLTNVSYVHIYIPMYTVDLKFSQNDSRLWNKLYFEVHRISIWREINYFHGYTVHQ